MTIELCCFCLSFSYISTLHHYFRIPCCSQVPCVWIWIPLMATLMRRCGDLWNSHISRTLCLACLTNSTMSVQRVERISGTNSWQDSSLFITWLIPDPIVSDWIFWALVWVSGSWFAWLELSSGKPRFWFWMKPLQLWIWRRTIWYSPLSALSLRTAPFWPLHIASTPSWTTQGAKKVHVYF